MKKLVSVIIPTYNRADLLSESVMSVINQTYRPIECIVVDDGSKDHTRDVIQRLKENADVDFSLVYLMQENLGAQIARNTGTFAASGDFIQYLDSDDLLYPNKIKDQVEFLNAHPDCSGVFGNWDIGIPEKHTAAIAFKSDDLISQFLTGRCIHTLSFLFRKTIVNQTGGWDVFIKRNQEIDFHIRAILAGATFEYVNVNTGLWRTHDEARITNTSGLSDFHYFFNKMKALLIEKGLYTNTLSKKIAGMYAWFLNTHWNESQGEIYRFCAAILELDPDRKMYSSKLWDVLFTICGRKLGLKIWIAIIKLRKRFSSETNFTA